MTLIGITTGPDRAELVTDHFSLGANYGRHTGTVNKVHLVSHLDAAMTVQGDHTFFGNVSYAISQAAMIRTFDELVAQVAESLPDLWRGRWNGAKPPTEHHDSTCYLVGYSADAGRFSAYSFPSAHDFDCVDLTGDLFLFPAPYTEYAQPTSLEEWAELAHLVYTERSLDRYLTGRRAPTGGRIVHTQLEVGTITQRTIAELPLAGPMFHHMMNGFNHPSSQLAPCYCGSGTASILCCDREHDDQPCECGSGSRFADCCRVDPSLSDDAPCPCLSGSVLADCCRPVQP